MRTHYRLLIVSSAVLVLLAVFSLYLRPSFFGDPGRSTLGLLLDIL